MVKKKNLWSLLAIMMVAMLSLSLSSCGDDDDDEGGGGNPLVGTWSCSSHYIDRVSFEGGTDTFTFKSNGTYEWKCRGWDNESGKYYYNNSLNTLTITNQKGTTLVYIIPTLTDSYFVMIDEDGDSYTYSKK